MRLVDVKATDGSLVNPEYVVTVEPCRDPLAPGECYVHMADRQTIFSNMPAEEVAKTLKGEPTKEQLAALEAAERLILLEKEMLRPANLRRDSGPLQQQIQERQDAPFMSHSIKIKPDDAWKWWDRAPTT